MAKQILATKGIHIPVVTTLHGTDITLVGQDPSYEPVVTFSINVSDVVTAVSASLRDDTYALFPITRQIDVIHNFIDLNRFRRQQKDHFKLAICPNGEKLLMHISNFRKVKRIEDILYMFAKLRPSMAIKLLLVGDGPERHRMEGLCRELDIADDVRFLGKLEVVEEILSVADLFIMPSEKESFGLAALEAMACEVPVLSSNTGGLPELQIQGQTGYMVPVGDIDAAVARAREILDDANLPRFKAAALARAVEFDISNIVPKYEAAYAKALEQVAILN
jgi:N-acetyl-alpha-D-glucosaminyl L-malate synthase BshA